MGRKKQAARDTNQSTSGSAEVAILDQVGDNGPMNVVPVTVSNQTSLKGKNKMSKTETSANPSTAIELKVKAKFIDLASLEEKVAEDKLSFTPAANYSEAVDRLGNDEAALVSAINDILAARAISAKRKELIGANGINRKIVMDFINPFRMSPEFSKMVTLEKGQDGWKPQYNAQTKALLKQVASNEFMLNHLKATAVAAPDTADETDEEETK